MPQNILAIRPVDTKAICSPQAAANFFLNKARAEKIPLTPMQLNKLVYIAHGWSLAALSRPLFDEKVEAWQHGPVIPSLYHEFKHYGKEPVTEPAVNLDMDNQVYIPEVNSNEQQALLLLNKVWNVYKGLTGSQLRHLTHKAGTPWRDCFEDGTRHICIPNNKIQNHYIEVLKNVLGDTNVDRA